MSYYEDEDRYLGAQPHLDQIVQYRGKKYVPFQTKNSKHIFMKPAQYATQEQKSRVYTGPVHNQQGKIVYIPQGNIHKASAPRRHQLGHVEAYRTGRYTQAPRQGPPRGRKQSIVSERGRSQSVGSQRPRSNSVSSHKSHMSQKSQKGKGKAHVNPKDPLLTAVNIARRVISKTPKDKPVEVDAETEDRIHRANQRTSEEAAKGEGVFAYAPVDIYKDLVDVDIGAVKGLSKYEANKIFNPTQNKIRKAVKSLRKMQADHQDGQKVWTDLVAENLPGHEYSHMTKEEAALEIVSKVDIKIKSEAQFERIFPYVLAQTELKANRGPGGIKVSQKEIIQDAFAWVFNPSPVIRITGFDFRKYLVGTTLFPIFMKYAATKASTINNASVKLITNGHKPPGQNAKDAIEHAHGPVHRRSGTETMPYTRPRAQEPNGSTHAPTPAGYAGYVNETRRTFEVSDIPVGSCWHENGDFALYHALHAHLQGMGYDVGPSPYAEGETLGSSAPSSVPPTVDQYFDTDAAPSRSYPPRTVGMGVY